MGIIINLFNNKRENEAQYDDYILEQWKICVEMADKISERRNSTNNFFLTLNSGLVAFSVLFEYKKEILIAIIGLCICILWIENIANYKKLNSYKFKIINELEKKLPSQPFNYEWHIADKGNNKKIYRKFTDIEKLVPKLFISIYIGVLIYHYICYLTKLLN